MHDTHSPPTEQHARDKPGGRTRGVFEKYAGSGVWYVRYQDHTGKIRKKKVGPKALAIRVYKKLTGQVAEKRAFPDPPPPPPPPWDPSFAERMEDYLSRKASLLRDGAGARRYARYFREAPETQGKTMRALTTEDFERYRERRLRERAHGARRKRGAASPTTVNKELSFARAVFYDFIEALEDRGLSPTANPLRTRLFLPEPAHRTRYLTEDEEARLLTALPEADRPKATFALLTGLDRGAQFGLEWAQVDFQTRTIVAERRKGRRKGTTPITVPINDELLGVLRDLPSRLASRWVFPNVTGTGPGDGRAFDRLIFRPALRTAGIKEFRWKDLRHTFATRLRMANVEIQTIRDLLGHTTTRMTERYSHAAPSYLLAATQKISRTRVADDAPHRDPATDPALSTEHTSAKIA